ncbi:MAG: HD domain-containing protein [Clostridia bacterium]|nr:HD domain-containing protein [Clostridia bacterium]
MRKKDGYTVYHCERVADLVIGYSKYYNLSPNLIKKLKYSAILHDIGKLIIPKRILLKKGELSGSEYNKIKQHPYAGYIIVRYILNMKDEASIIRMHHERIDGKGYPDHLKGNQINDLSKLLSICDAFDAMTNDRVYRKALDKNETIHELKQNSGTQFDKKILNKFLKYLDSKTTK